LTLGQRDSSAGQIEGLGQRQQQQLAVGTPHAYMELQLHHQLPTNICILLCCCCCCCVNLAATGVIPEAVRAAAACCPSSCGGLLLLLLL
jgi:hypothetical protein